MDLAGGGTQLTGLSATVTVTNADAADKLRANLLEGIDTLTVMQTGTAGSVRRVEVDGGTDQDTINVLRTAADGVVVVIPSSGNDSINANAANQGAANVLFESSARIGGLNVGLGGVVKIAPGGGKVLTATTVSISLNGRIDLTDNALIDDYIGGGSSPFTQMQTQIVSGYNNGAWNGATGIISSTAAGQQGFAIGYAEANAIFNSFPATFKGQIVDNSAVLMTY